MKIETLREFVVLAKMRSFTRTAEELHLTQPAVSMHIAALEKKLGLTLVDRRSGATLTPAGQRLLAGIQDALAAFDDAVADCRTFGGGHAPVRVRTTGDIPFLPDLLDRAHGIPIELIEVGIDTYAPLEDLQRDIVDVTTIYDFSFAPDIVRMANKNDIATERVGADRLFIYMASTNPLASRKHLGRADLQGATVAIISTKWHDFMVQQACHLLGSGLDLKFRVVPVNSPLALRYVNLDGAVTLAGINSDQLMARDDVTAFDTLDGEPIIVDQMIAYRSDNPNPNVQAFVDTVVDYSQPSRS